MANTETHGYMANTETHGYMANTQTHGYMANTETHGYMANYNYPHIREKYSPKFPSGNSRGILFGGKSQGILL